MSRPNSFWLVASVVVVCLMVVLTGWADSHVRMVRLSSVEGDVVVDRDIGQGYEKAFLNLPITEGTKLQTKDDGRAEVEFEDGSTVRITPDTVISFLQLTMEDSGGKTSTIHVQEGTAYISFLASKGDQLKLTFGKETVSFTRAAHLRLEMGDAEATLSVFKGDIEVAGTFGKTDVASRQSLTFDLADQSRYTLAKDLEQDPYDSWDKQALAYQQRYATNPSYNGFSPYTYGTSDLNYYGSFSNIAGYGWMWQPYFVGAGWDPFMNGAWAFYPGFGYSWVSGYPWGWTPYNSGAWMFLPGYGWMWQSGGWGGLGMFPTIINPPLGYVSPRPPNIPAQHLVEVNRGPLPNSVNPGKLTIANNSAGLGIPRGGLRNLPKDSENVQQHGFISAKVHNASLPTTNWWGGFGQTSVPGRSAGNGGWRGTSGTSMSSGHSGGFSGGHYGGFSGGHSSGGFSGGHGGGGGGHR